VSIPYVMKAIGRVVIFQEEPKETHVLAVKRIFIYLKVTTYFGLWYLKGNELNMVTYTDADWEGSIDDRISTSVVYFYLHDFLMS
jgi:hypothetical protein